MKYRHLLFPALLLLNLGCAEPLDEDERDDPENIEEMEEPEAPTTPEEPEQPLGPTDPMEPEEPTEPEEPGGPITGDLPTDCMGERSSTGVPRAPVAAMQAVGDSILGWNKEESAAIPDVVGQRLGVSMSNNAVGGSTLLSWEDGTIAELYEPGTYSHVLVNGGGNDFAAECSKQTLDRLVSPDLKSGALVDLIERVSGDGAQAIIIGYYLPRDRETGCEHFPELLRRYRELGKTREDAVYVCTLDVITPKTPQFYADPVHPSKAGSAAVGEAIARQLRP